MGQRNRIGKDLLAKNNIEIYSTENEEKSSVCERWNRTIKEKMYKRFTMQNNTVYIGFFFQKYSLLTITVKIDQ